LRLRARTLRPSPLSPTISQPNGGDPDAVTEVCIDMGPGFINGTADSLPKAAVTFDRFHAVKIVNEAVDQVRRTERRVHKMLAGTRSIWQRYPADRSERERANLESPPLRHLETSRAYQIRLAFQELYDQRSTEAGAAFLKRWYFWATHSPLPPIIDAARTVRRRWDGILRWFDCRIANGLIEGINSLVQAAKAKARGYRSIRNLKANGLSAHRKIRSPTDSLSISHPHQTAKNQTDDRGAGPREELSGGLALRLSVRGNGPAVHRHCHRANDRQMATQDGFDAVAIGQEAFKKTSPTW